MTENNIPVSFDNTESNKKILESNKAFED